MKNSTRASIRDFLPIFAVFLVVSFVIISIPSSLKKWNIDRRVILAGNEVIFIVTAISYWLNIKGLRSPNPYAFVRMVFGSLLVKMLVCCVAVLFYGLLGHGVNRNGIIGCFILYIIYTFLEVRVLTQLTKKLPKNA